MSASLLSGEFIEGEAGQILVVLRQPAVPSDQCVLFVPPFGEEMNKCRRQFTETAIALNERGVAAALPDLYGTGDSEGDFSAARWSIWRTDLERTIRWLAGRGQGVESAIAVRLGAALLSDALANRSTSLARAMFWQPVTSGKQFLGQFMRLRIAASMMASGGGETAESLAARLAADGELEIAGYVVSEGLWRDIERLDLPTAVDRQFERVAITEVSRSSREGLSPAVSKLAARIGEKGVDVTGAKVPGDPFWTATEIVTNPELTAHTVDWLTAP